MITKMFRVVVTIEEFEFDDESGIADEFAEVGAPQMLQVVGDTYEAVEVREQIITHFRRGLEDWSWLN